MTTQTKTKRGRGRPRKESLKEYCPFSGIELKSTIEKPSKTRDEIDMLKEHIERIEFILEGHAHAIEFQETDNVLQETKRLLGKY